MAEGLSDRPRILRRGMRESSKLCEDFLDDVVCPEGLFLGILGGGKRRVLCWDIPKLPGIHRAALRFLPQTRASIEKPRLTGGHTGLPVPFGGNL